MAPILEGWAKVTSSRYLNPAGEEVSRRQYLNAVAREVGFSSYSEFQRLNSKTTHEGNLRLTWMKLASEKQGIPLREIKRIDSSFNRLYLAARREGFRGRKPDSATAQFLSYFTARSMGAQYEVGETPEEFRR